MKHRTESPLARGTVAFTLVEIALSMGIASFALIGILGIIPIGIETAKESRDETRATFIALAIIETLRSGPEGSGIVQVHADQEYPIAYESIALRTISGKQTYNLAYDTGGKFLGRMTGYNYTTGAKTLPGTVFIARIILQRDSELFRSEVSVETPAIAAESNRKKYSYVTFLRP